MKAQESCAFVSELNFGEGFDLASEMDDKNGEATSATLGIVLLPGFSAQQTVSGVFGDPKARVDVSRWLRSADRNHVAGERRLRNR